MTESMSDIGYAGVTGIPTSTSPKTMNSHRKKTWITHLAVAGWLCAAAGSAVAQDSLRARNLAATCANCHGTNGHARDGMMPLAGVNAESVSLLADATDFLGDAANYGISLYVLGLAMAWRARAALLKAPAWACSACG